MIKELDITHGLDAELAGERRADQLGAQFREYRELRDAGATEQAALARSTYQAVLEDQRSARRSQA